MDTPRLLIHFVPEIPPGRGPNVTEYGHGTLYLRDSLSPIFVRLLTEKAPVNVFLSIGRSSSGAENFHIEIDTDFERTELADAGRVWYEEQDERGVVQHEERTARRATPQQEADRIHTDS
jgi:hypothetical protein